VYRRGTEAEARWAAWRYKRFRFRPHGWNSARRRLTSRFSVTLANRFPRPIARAALPRDTEQQPMVRPFRASWRIFRLASAPWWSANGSASSAPLMKTG